MTDQPTVDHVLVHYRVPVVVVVDLASRTVRHVVVVDDEVRLDAAAVDDRPEAIDLAESEAWPQWRFGW